jgi:hypothetical protein
MVRESKTTDVDGRMKLSAPVRTGWRVERVLAPGYATDCPTDADPFGEYDLVQDNHYFHDQDVSYVCHLVPPATLVIRDRKAAIAAAKKHPEIEDWLRTHRDARATASATALRTGMAATATASDNAAAWRVDFETRSGQDHEVAFVSGLGLVWLPDWPMAAPTIPPSGRR